MYAIAARLNSARMQKRVGPCVRATALASLSILTLPAFAADVLVPAGTNAKLSVEYIYESAGSESSEGMYDPYVWKVKRTAKLEANLSAQAPTELPTMQAMTADQVAGIEAKQEKFEAAAEGMQPMMADIEKIMAKCGEDEACITAAVTSMGMGMAGTPELDSALAAGQLATEAGQPGEMRYQRWQATAQTGTYSIEETAHILSTDPICMSHPGGKCTRDEVRRGSGAIPLPPGAAGNPAAATGFSAIEVDNNENSFVMTLPVPGTPLPYTETITTDEPEGTHDTPTPTGPQQKLLVFRVNDGSSASQDKPYTVAIQGDFRNQSGQQVFNLPGSFGDRGKLTVRWRLTVL